MLTGIHTVIVDEKTVVSLKPHARAINCFHQMVSDIRLYHSPANVY